MQSSSRWLLLGAYLRGSGAVCVRCASATSATDEGVGIRDRKREWDVNSSRCRAPEHPCAAARWAAYPPGAWRAGSPSLALPGPSPSVPPEPSVTHHVQLTGAFERASLSDAACGLADATARHAARPVGPVRVPRRISRAERDASSHAGLSDRI